MTSTIDSGTPLSSLTSLSQPRAERCLHLLTPGRRTDLRVSLVMFLCAVVLPIGAVALGAYSLKYGFAFVICMGLVCLVLSRPVVGGWLLVGLVPTTSGLAPGFPVQNVRISEALIGLIGVTVLLGTRRLTAVRWGTLEWLLLGWGLVWAVLSTYDSIVLRQHLTLSQWGTVIGQLQFFLLYRTVRVTLRTRRERIVGLAILFVAVVPMTLIAILQEVNIGGLRTTLSNITGNISPLQTQGIIRATGVFGNWAALAGYLMPLFLVLVALALGRQLRRYPRAALCLATLMVIGIVLTAELSVLACTVLGVVYIGARYSRFAKTVRWLAIAAVVCAVVVGPVLASRFDQQFGAVAGSSRSALVPQTVQFREQVWTQQYLPAIAQRPLTGWGVELPQTIQWPYPESQYIAVLIEGGYALLVMYLILLWAMFDRARNASRSRDPVEQALGRALLVCVVSLVPLGAIWPFFSNGGLPQVLWCLFALAEPAVTRLPVSPATRLEPTPDVVGDLLPGVR